MIPLKDELSISKAKPVAGVTIHVQKLSTTPEQDLTPILNAWRAGKKAGRRGREEPFHLHSSVITNCK